MLDLLLLDVLVLHLDDPLQGLAEGDGLGVAVVEVEGVGEVAGGLE